VRRLAVAAAVAALMLLPWAIVYRTAFRGDSETLTADATASHVRSMMGDHLLDVPSTDQHTVKPWFNGKLDFSPAVADLAKSGFPLVGGRLDYLNNRPVAALVYRRNQHVINVYTWPSKIGDREPSAAERNGYHVLTWMGGGMNWVAVSDVNAPELRQFVDKLAAEVRAASANGQKSR
jgi:anti-sigma factor RsiW